MTLQNDIISLLPDRKNYIVGFADMGDLIRDHYPYRYAVVIGKKPTMRSSTTLRKGRHRFIMNSTKAPTMNSTPSRQTSAGFWNETTSPASRSATVQQTDIPAGFGKTLRMNFSHKMAATRAPG